MLDRKRRTWRFVVLLICLLLLVTGASAGTSQRRSKSKSRRRKPSSKSSNRRHRRRQPEPQTRTPLRDAGSAVLKMGTDEVRTEVDGFPWTRTEFVSTRSPAPGDLKRRLEGAPGEAIRLFTAGNDLHASDPLAAVAEWRRCVETCNNNELLLIMSKRNIAMVYEETMATRKATDILDEVLELVPNDVEVLLKKCYLHQSIGEFEAADAFCERVTRIDNLIIEAHYQRFSVNDTMADSDIENLKHLLVHELQLSVRERVQIGFVLYRTYNRRRDFVNAWRYIYNANRMYWGMLSTNARSLDALKNGEIRSILLNVFTKEFIQLHHDNGWLPDTSGDVLQPIFVCGLPRSGSTLTDEVLQSHPSVYSIGEHGYDYEFYDFHKTLTAVYHQQQKGVKPIDIRLPEGDLQQMHDTFYAALQQRFVATGADTVDVRFLLDKGLSNYELIGILHLIFPNAKFVVCMRPPMEAMLANYLQPTVFGFAQYYTYDMRATALKWKHFYACVDHWHKALPDGFVYNHMYEDFVQDPIVGARRLFAHVGIPDGAEGIISADGKTLEFWKNREDGHKVGSITLASFVQSRITLVSCSINHARLCCPMINIINVSCLFF
jgi:hypothetical protein